jgi:hypothetical protein
MSWDVPREGTWRYIVWIQHEMRLIEKWANKRVPHTCSHFHCNWRGSGEQQRKA